MKMHYKKHFPQKNVYDTKNQFVSQINSFMKQEEPSRREKPGNTKKIPRKIIGCFDLPSLSLWKANIHTYQ